MLRLVDGFDARERWQVRPASRPDQRPQVDVVLVVLARQGHVGRAHRVGQVREDLADRSLGQWLQRQGLAGAALVPPRGRSGLDEGQFGDPAAADLGDAGHQGVRPGTVEIDEQHPVGLPDVQRPVRRHRDPARCVDPGRCGLGLREDLEGAVEHGLLPWFGHSAQRGHRGRPVRARPARDPPDDVRDQPMLGVAFAQWGLDPGLPETSAGPRLRGERIVAVRDAPSVVHYAVGRGQLPHRPLPILRAASTRRTSAALRTHAPSAPHRVRGAAEGGSSARPERISVTGRGR